MKGLCVICGRRAVHRHHLVKQQRIRARWRSARYRNFGKAPWKLTVALNDPRLFILVCGFDGCHREETPVPVPPGFADAVREYGLEPDLPRWMDWREGREPVFGVSQATVSRVVRGRVRTA